MIAVLITFQLSIWQQMGLFILVLIVQESKIVLELYHVGLLFLVTLFQFASFQVAMK